METAIGPLGRVIRRIQSPILTAAMGALIGVAIFEGTLGLALVQPTRIGWLMGQAPGDFAPHFLGWHFFRHEPWRFPLGVTSGFIYPIGTSVGLTDSIPLLAIPLKALHVLEGRDFQYLGSWLMCSFVLQGMFAALLARTRTDDCVAQALAAALFVLAPPLLARSGHTALTAQWMLVACLWVYFDCEDAQHYRRAAWRLTIVMALAAVVHPYLAFMVFALCAAHFGRVLLIAPRQWLGSAVLPATVMTMMTVVLFWQCGYVILPNDALQAGGLSDYSMNVMAPFMPMGQSWLLPRDPFSTATEGQYEGFAYFGAGTLALACVALAAAIAHRNRVEWSRRVPVIAVCALLTILAFSPRVTVGGTTVLHYSEAWFGPLRQFRATGRLFWPAFYGLMFAIVSTVVTRITRFRARLLLVGALALQSVDAAGAFARARTFRELSWRSPLRTEQFWTNVLPRYQHVSLYPTNLCAAPLIAIDYLAFGLAAGRYGTTLNAGQATRLDARSVSDYCRDQQAAWEAGAVQPDTLYVMSIRLALGFGRRAPTPTACIDMDEFGVCFARETYQRWQDAFDVNLATLSPLLELVQFRDVLEAEYRDVLKSAPHTVYGSAAERARLIARFVSYRLTGCDLEEATGKIARELAGERELRLCTYHRSRRLSALEDPGRTEQLPARDETVRLLRFAQDFYREKQQSAPLTAHLDAEGEAVWLQEYIRHRLRGRNPSESEDLVLRDIRAVRP